MTLTTSNAFRHQRRETLQSQSSNMRPDASEMIVSMGDERRSAYDISRPRRGCGRSGRIMQAGRPRLHNGLASILWTPRRARNHTLGQGGVHVRKAKAVYTGIQTGGSATG